MVDTDPDVGQCHVCGDEVQIDGEQAVERWGDVLCWDCSSKPVVFEAHCENQLCDWEVRREDNEFDRGHVEQLVRSEAKSHRKRKRVFDDDPTHRTVVEEIERAAEE